MASYTVEINADETTEKLLDEAFSLAAQLDENKEYLDKPWFTREYQLTLALNGSALSARGRELSGSWVNESLIDHINDMKKLLNG